MDASNEQAAVVYFGDQPFRFCECTRNRTLDATLNHDGCLGFCPKGPEGTRDALICGTCNCHRNYHRKELVVFVPPVMRQDEYKHQVGASVSSEKRNRTKFTQGQKDRMMAFAQGLGWRVKKEDEASVGQFCAEIGVEKKVLKVWMNNNKHTLGKMP